MELMQSPLRWLSTTILVLIVLVGFPCMAQNALEGGVEVKNVSDDDGLVEFLSPDCEGKTFVTEVNSPFERTRRTWRKGAGRFHISTSQDKISAAKEFLLGPDHHRPSQNFPLKVIIAALREVWPQLADDIPSEERVSQFGLASFISGAWQYPDC